MYLRKALLTLYLATCSFSCHHVVTYHNDNYRTGAQLDETLLTPDVVGQFGMRIRYKAAVDNDISAQPLYVPDVSFPLGLANALYVVTENNSVFCFDADTGAKKWMHVLLDSSPSLRSLPRGSTNSPVTPVIDSLTETMYVLFSTKNQYLDLAWSVDGEIALESTLDVAYWLVGLDIRTGTELRRIQVKATTLRSDGSTLSFDARRQVNHPALLLDHGSLYLAFGSRALEGISEFHGWVVRYDAATFRPQGVFCTTADARGASPGGGGIWQGGAGLAADRDGNVYFLVGNAPADPTNHSYGDSFVKLTPSGDTLVFAGSVAPPNAALLDEKDLDLGSGGLIVIPDTRLLVGGGKTGTIYLVDGDTMTILQSFQAFTNTYHPNWNFGCPVPKPPDCDDWSAGPHLHGSPTYWRGSNPSFAYFYHWAEKDYLKQFKFDLATKRFDESPLVGSVRATGTMMPGGIMSLSAYGNTAGTAVLWAVLPSAGASHVYAFNAETLETLWDAPFPASLPVMSHYAPPTIADGKLIVATASNMATASNGIVVYEPRPLPRFWQAPRKLPWHPYQPGDPPGPTFAERFESERSIVALPALRREELAPPLDQVAVFRARAQSDGNGERFDGGRRYGATWEAADGSRLTAEEVKVVSAPDKRAPSWQLFKVTAHEGRGRLDSIGWIQRIDTDGKEATYVFYSTKLR